MASNPIVNMFRLKELRIRLLFTLLVLAVFRLGSVLTIPGIDANVLFNYFSELANQNKNAFASYMDFFVGGAFSNFSIFMLGVMPYISTQIIMQLAVIIFPSLKRIVQEDGGQRKMAQWIRLGTVLVCILQSYAVTVYAGSIPGCILIAPRWKFNVLAMLTVTTGSMITVWLGDQITANGIGNGISMMIFAGIVARIPSAIVELYKKVMDGSVQFVFVIVVLLMFVAIIALVVYEEGCRKKNVWRKKHVHSFQNKSFERDSVDFCVFSSDVAAPVGVDDRKQSEFLKMGCKAFHHSYTTRTLVQCFACDSYSVFCILLHSGYSEPYGNRKKYP